MRWLLALAAGVAGLYFLSSGGDRPRVAEGRSWRLVPGASLIVKGLIDPMTELLPFSFALLFALVAALAIGVALSRTKAKASVAGHVPGAGFHAGGGSADSTKHNTVMPQTTDRSARLLRLKRELLERWAMDGRPIDIVAEAQAELVALEIEERANAWRDYTASAADEPIVPERPFAS